MDMNPFNNRWAMLGVVAVFLVVVAELVGADGSGGFLSQTAGANSAAQGEALPPGVVHMDPALEAASAEPSPEDLPQLIQEDSPDIVDASEPGEGSDAEQGDVESDPADEAFVDNSGEEFTDDSGE